VDEVLTLADGTMAPFDYKFAEAPAEVYHNLKVQSAVYGLLIRETFGAEVRRGYLCYIRSKHRVVEVPHAEEDFEEARGVLRQLLPKYLHTIRAEAQAARRAGLLTSRACEKRAKPPKGKTERRLRD
jgi:hypothetical protein